MEGKWGEEDEEEFVSWKICLNYLEKRKEKYLSDEHY